MNVPLLALRHAPTEWNRRGLIQGRRDVPLSDAGRAEAASWRLPAGWEDAACLASPLARTMETARLLRFEPTPHPALLEMDWGHFEGETLAAIRARLGPAMAENEARGLDFQPEDGESPREVRDRLAAFLPTLGRPTVLVTHKGVLRALLSLATGWTMRNDPPEKLRDGRAHQFELNSAGDLRVVRLNLPLHDRP